MLHYISDIILLSSEILNIIFYAYVKDVSFVSFCVIELFIYNCPCYLIMAYECAVESNLMSWTHEGRVKDAIHSWDTLPIYSWDTHTSSFRKDFYLLSYVLVLLIWCGESRSAVHS